MITKQKTFDILNEWLNKIREIGVKDFLMVLIENKSDLKENRVIYKNEGEKFARENEIKLYYTSCAYGTNIENSILILIYEIIEKQKKRLKALEQEKEKQEGKVKNQSKIKFKLKNKNENKKEKKGIVIMGGFYIFIIILIIKKTINIIYLNEI